MKKVKQALRFQKPSDFGELRNRVHPKHVHVEKEDLVKAFFREVIRKQVGVKNRNLVFGCLVTNAFCSDHFHIPRAIDQGKMPGGKFRGDKRDRMTITAANFEDEIRGTDIQNLDGPDVAFGDLACHAF